MNQACGAAERAFDAMADGYDAAFTDSAVGVALRALVWARVDASFAPGQEILELGCGTGEDAVHLARRGLRVTATDASARMLDIARAKAARLNCQSRISFHCLPMQALGTAFHEARFDGVLSNFGAINCVADVPTLARTLAARMPTGARLLWVVMGRHVPWEWAWYLARGDAMRAFRRLRAGGVEWRGLTVRYPTPSQLGAALAPYFRLRNLQPIGCVLPPTYASGWLERSPRARAAMARLERAAQSASALAHCSDHYLVEAERVELRRSSAVVPR